MFIIERPDVYSRITEAEQLKHWFDDSQATSHHCMNGGMAEGTASLFRGTTICLLASTSTVRMYGFEHLKHWFEDDPQGTSSQTARRSRNSKAFSRCFDWFAVVMGDIRIFPCQLLPD